MQQTSDSSNVRLHVIVITHTPRHLDGVFAGLSRQTIAPDTITLSCDVDDAEIGAIAEQWRDQCSESVVRWVRRSHMGKARPSQTRNNGVRALQEAGTLRQGDLLLFLDGDMVVSDTTLSEHLNRALQGFDLTIPFRVCLNEEQTTLFEAENYARGRYAIEADESELQSINALQKKYEGHLRWRGWPWIKAYKPRLIGCHHSIRAETFLSVNGYDEEYFNWGNEDDDISLRMNMLRPRTNVSIDVDKIIAYHLWHPQRTKVRNERERFKRRNIPLYCEHGMSNPLPQTTPEVSMF